MVWIGLSNPYQKIKPYQKIRFLWTYIDVILGDKVEIDTFAAGALILTKVILLSKQLKFCLSYKGP